MPTSDFNKVAEQVYWNRTSAWMFSCKFAAYFQNVFSKEHVWVAASEFNSLCVMFIKFGKLEDEKTIQMIFI